ncbi:hypothetical protein [Alloacidobacterium sp.]|uniref:hypothetical protein n=1 Tax=Alloacidobacterium sp. TaxID=2951999 RepID=UPI002D51713B|nr:hypothetical protein [Alloacidobacterium sp.]HYK38080.1 hypothetical protein [Alloacidobacterium sp.]
MKALAILAAVSLLSVLAQGQVEKSGPWEMQSSGTTASLRGIHAVGGGVAWASGTNGTVLRTEDSGYMWQSCGMPPGAEKLDFRGIWAWDANTAIVMSSGPGDESRLYKTTDGCSHWTLLYTNPDKNGFWDAIVFTTRGRGILLGDPVAVRNKNGRSDLALTILKTLDGGKTWIQDPALEGSIWVADGTGAFAASNSSLAIFGDAVWFGTGGKSGAHVYIAKFSGPISQPEIMCDCAGPLPGLDPSISRYIAVPLASGADASGVFSLAFRDSQHGMAVGGDYTKPNESAGTAAWTADGGQHWTAAEKPPHGYRSAVAWDADAKAWIAAGTNGSDISYDDGKNWQPLDNGNWNALSLPWIVGPKGRIAKLGTLPPHK